VCPGPRSALAFYDQLGYGVNQKRMQATMSPQTSILGVERLVIKAAPNASLLDAGVPVPKARSSTADELSETVKQSAAQYRD